jgi:hypothetical protein
LSTLQFHLSNNQHEEAQKLISWRKKILQLASIVGWDIAMLVARNTKDKLTVDSRDILSTNVDYLKRMYSLWCYITQAIIKDLMQLLYNKRLFSFPFSKVVKKAKVDVDIFKTSLSVVLSEDVPATPTYQPLSP